VKPGRSRRLAAVVVCAALGVSACGHYAPPIRSRPAAVPAAPAAPDVPDEPADSGDEETRSDVP